MTPGWSKRKPSSRNKTMALFFPLNETTPRAHADLCARFMADSNMKCWAWSKYHKIWLIANHPEWQANSYYHIGFTTPTQPPTGE